MALLWFEGFDDFLATTTSKCQDYLSAKGWASNGTWPVSGGTSLTRFQSGFCMESPGSGANYEFGKLLNPAEVVSEGVFGAAFNCTSDNIGNGMAFKFRDYNAPYPPDQFQVVLSNTQVIIRYNFNTGFPGFSQVSTPNLTWFTDTWNYIEIKFKISATAGYVQVRINGAPVAQISGVNTQAYGRGSDPCNSIFFSNAAYSDSYIDDIYLLDLTGTVNNDFLGEQRVYVVEPDSPGDLTNWTPNGAATNWQAASNYDPSTTTIYNSSTTVGAEDLYNLTSIRSDVTIQGILVSGSYLHNDAGFYTVRNILKTGGTIYEGSPIVTAPMSYLASHDVYQLNPHTGVGWTPSDIASLQIGPKIEDIIPPAGTGGGAGGGGSGLGGGGGSGGSGGGSGTGILPHLWTTANDPNTQKMLVSGDDYWVQNANQTWSVTNPGADDTTLKFEVHSGDVWAPIDSGLHKNRSEIASTRQLTNGTTFHITYNWTVPIGYPTNTATWLTSGQLRQQVNDSWSAPFGIYMDGEKMRIAICTAGSNPNSWSYYVNEYVDTSDITRGHAYAMDITVKFDNTSGSLVVKRDGVTLVSYSGPLGYSAMGSYVYWKEGVYREDNPDPYAIIFDHLSIS